MIEKEPNKIADCKPVARGRNLIEEKSLRHPGRQPSASPSRGEWNEEIEKKRIETEQQTKVTLNNKVRAP